MIKIPSSLIRNKIELDVKSGELDAGKKELVKGIQGLS
jgi:hypothetical protein